MKTDMYVWSRIADPGVVDPVPPFKKTPDPAVKKKTDPHPILEKQPGSGSNLDLKNPIYVNKNNIIATLPV